MQCSIFLGAWKMTFQGFFRVYMHYSTVKLHQFHSSTWKKFQSRLFSYKSKNPQKAPKPNFLMKEPKVLSWEGGLKRREIVNLSPLFYALKRRRVHKFGFAALCALFLVGENCVKWSRQIELLLRSRFDCHLIFGVEGNDTWPNDGVPDPIPIQNHY